MKKLTGFLILFLLMLGLGTVLFLRTDHLTAVNHDGQTAEETMPAADAVSDDGGEAISSPEPSAMPEETPPPTPAPRPLRSVLLSEDGLPEELLRPAEHRGTVFEEDYQTRDMVSDLPYEIRKNVCVYLPYGYDPDGQYDVLILLHCAWADQRFWLEEERNYGTEDEPVPVSVPNLLDRMIEERFCEPLIVLSPCIYLYDGQPSNAGNAYDYAQFAREFGTGFLPWVAENYATYAPDGSREALREAREHFGVLGASFGAYTAYISLIGDNFDLVSRYTFCGGGEIDHGYLMNAWTERGTSDLPLGMLYICEGEFDDRAGPELSYYNLIHAGGAFGEDNVKFTLVRGWGHEDHSYLVGLYNTLQMFFR